MGTQEALSTDSTENAAVCSLHIIDIRKDGGTQTRRSLDASFVRHYCALLKDDIRLPPLRVWFDGTNYWLVDGFHRLAAAESAGFKYITAEVLHGPLEAAIWDSFSANSRHGLPRKKGDVKEVIRRTLQHPTAASLSNVQIAEHIGVPETTLRRWRKRLSSPSGEDTVRQATRGGKAYTIRTGNIGRHSVLRRPPQKPITQLHEEVAEMQRECSPGVARLLEIIEGWLFQGLPKAECVEQLEGLMSSPKHQRPAAS